MNLIDNRFAVYKITLGSIGPFTPKCTYLRYLPELKYFSLPWRPMSPFSRAASAPAMRMSRSSSNVSCHRWRDSRFSSSFYGWGNIRK
ncbi:hypothetical protein DPMN_110676 [Dreissena polymorpha]|uniref:Uncharacterized protein n=1 Tax=Dreissena polymorpha TaxID=45954 RepID=A0A9D4KCV0_DREPO|nr:hypothetical protein DPMN_110676 [Dreissena polymorpha]